jgi:crossover junction endodeoxyribonuclease RuvC
LKILGIDPGTRITGYGIVEKALGNKLIHICHGSIKADTDKPLSERLATISSELQAMIEEFQPDAVAVESVFFAKNVKSAITLGHARGIALLSAAANNLEVFEYAPTKIKQAVTGHGRADKAQVQKMIKLLLKTPEIPEPDAADALAIAVCHINHTGLLRSTLKAV